MLCVSGLPLCTPAVSCARAGVTADVTAGFEANNCITMCFNELGRGEAALQKFSAIMGIPGFAHNTDRRLSRKVCDANAEVTNIVLTAVVAAVQRAYNIIIIIIIIMIIAFKGAIRDFFLQSPHSAANCLQHARSSGPGAIVCKSRATHRVLITCKCHVTCYLVRRDSSAIKFDRVEIEFI